MRRIFFSRNKLAERPIASRYDEKMRKKNWEETEADISLAALVKPAAVRGIKQRRSRNAQSKVDATKENRCWLGQAGPPITPVEHRVKMSCVNVRLETPRTVTTRWSTAFVIYVSCGTVLRTCSFFHTSRNYAHDQLRVELSSSKSKSYRRELREYTQRKPSVCRVADLAFSWRIRESIRDD